MHIELLFTNHDHSVQIDLFDCPAVRRWFNYYHDLSLGLGREPLEHCQWRMLPISIGPDSEINLQQQWHRILASQHRLLAMGYQFPWQMPATWSGDQSTLNQLHRFFTQNAMWLSQKQTWANPYDPGWQLPKNTKEREFFAIIDEINEAVHCLESVSDSANRRWAQENFDLDMLLLERPRDIISQRGWVQFTAEEQEHNYTFLDHQTPLVLLNGSILGKSILHSFLDDDDPSESDCTGRLGSFGEFVIDLDTQRQKIYRSDRFTAWARRHRKRRRWPFEFAIGQVRDWKTQLVWLRYNNDSFQGLRFVPDPGAALHWLGEHSDRFQHIDIELDDPAPIAEQDITEIHDDVEAPIAEQDITEIHDDVEAPIAEGIEDEVAAAPTEPEPVPEIIPKTAEPAEPPPLPKPPVQWPSNAVSAAIEPGRPGFAIPGPKSHWHYYEVDGTYVKSWHADRGDYQDSQHPKFA